MAYGATVSALVTTGAAADNRTVEIARGTDSSIVSAAPSGAYAISDITPAGRRPGRRPDVAGPMTWRVAMERISRSTALKAGPRWGP